MTRDNKVRNSQYICFDSLGNPAAYASLLAVPGTVCTQYEETPYRFSRVVVLPHLQGVGLGSMLINMLAETYYCGGARRVSFPTSHPKLQAWFDNHPDWNFDKRVLETPSMGKNKVSVNYKQDQNRFINWYIYKDPQRVR